MKLTEEKLRNDLEKELSDVYVKIVSFKISDTGDIRIILEVENRLKYFIIENDKLEYYSNSDHSVEEFKYSRMLELALN